MTGTVNLPDLAAIWVARWLKYGGGLIADTATAKLSISMRMEHWRWRHGPQSQRLWHDAWFVGRWRELGDLLELVPGLYAAVVDHIAEHGEAYADGTKMMSSVGEHIGWDEAEPGTAQAG